MCYQRALQARPDYAMAYGNLATIYYEQGQLDMAIRCYNQAIVCDPQFVEAYNNTTWEMHLKMLDEWKKQSTATNHALRCKQTTRKP